MNNKQLRILAILAVGILVVISFWAKLTAKHTPTSITFTEPVIYVAIQSTEDPREYEAIITIANNPGIAGFNLALDFDNTKLTPVSVIENDTLMNGIIFSSNVMGATDEQKNAMPAATAVWASASDSDENGSLYTILFRVSEDVSSQTELTLISRGISNREEQSVDFILQGVVLDFCNFKAIQN